MTGAGSAAGKVRSHHDLVVWQKGMDLAVLVYRLVETFPNSERYTLTSQLTRAAVSVPANIAEGSARSTRKEYAQFISIARGSLAETETYILLAVRLGYATEDAVSPAMALVNEISRMLTALRARLATPQ